MPDLAAVAAFLGALRQKDRAVPVNAAEALLLIAAGVDHVNDLRTAMRDADGNPLPPATVNRLVSLLRGRARYSGGKWIESPYTLLEVRSHPHRRGLQLQLSEAGAGLIRSYFGANKCSSLLAPMDSTCEEKSL